MRKGKISLENVSGGEVTSAPLLSTPSKYSRLLQNFFINAAGHICKIPGYSAISAQVASAQLTTGIDFNKSDGTSIKIVGGLSGTSGCLYRLNSGVLTSIKTFTSTAPIYLSQIGDLIVASNGSDLPVSYDGTTLGNLSMPFSVRAVEFDGEGLNDMVPNVTASGASTYDIVIDGVAADAATYGGSGGLDDLTIDDAAYTGGDAATFDVEIDSAGSEDTVKYNLNGGTEVTDVALTTATAGSDLTVFKLKAAVTTGHLDTDYYEVQTVKSYFTTAQHTNLLAAIANMVTQATTMDAFGETAFSAELNKDAIYASATSYIASADSAIAICTTILALYPAYTALATFKTNVNTGRNYAGLIQATKNQHLYSLMSSYCGIIKTHTYNNIGNFSSTKDTFKWRKNGGVWSAETTCPLHPTYNEIDANYSIAFVIDVGNTVDNTIRWQVDGATTPDTFKWRKNAETYTETVPITSGAITLKEGMVIEFTHFTGHTLAVTPDSWAITAAQDTVKYRTDAGAWTEGVAITGAYQTITTGVQFKFGAINGHTLGDQWTIPVDQTVRFGKSYTYKGRLWLIGDDKQTIYYSVLNVPTDFVSDGSGYIDLRYVVAEGDELVDIASVMNYLIFFMKNHIVVYSGTDPTAEGDFVIYQNIPDMGLLAANTIITVGSDVYFLTNKGIKSLKQVLTAGALNIDNVSQAIDLDIIAAIDANTDEVYASAHYATLGLIMFLIGTTIFVYNYRQSAWSRMVIPSDDDVSKVLSMFQTADGYVYMGGYDYLFEFDPSTATYNFNGVAPEYRWTSGMLAVTKADAMYFQEMILRLASTKAATITLKVRAVGFDTTVADVAAFNQQDISISAITTNDAVFNFVRVPIEGAGKFIQFDFTESPLYTLNDDLEIVGLEVAGELGVL